MTVYILEGVTDTAPGFILGVYESQEEALTHALKMAHDYRKSVDKKDLHSVIQVRKFEDFGV